MEYIPSELTLFKHGFKINLPFKFLFPIPIFFDKTKPKNFRSWKERFLQSKNYVC